MFVSDWLREATRQLEEASIGTARLDALVLLEDVTKITRARLLAEPERKLSPAQVIKLEKLLTRRAGHVPLAYVRGRTEFYGRDFVITPAVLEPRPESETMIDLLKELPDLGTQPLIADIGAGSGALGITAALEVPNAAVELIDIDPKALQVAKTNVDKFTLNMSVIGSDLLLQAKRNHDVLLCNLPYVPDDYQINRAALHEPKIAIFGGPDGLNVYRKLFRQLEKRPLRPLYILTESLPTQHDKLVEIASKGGYQLTRENDFILVFRRAQN